jgi:serine phosphatase RsbU (regulator of sigma subunit)/Tfp pilus assembly protein PilF
MKKIISCFCLLIWAHFAFPQRLDSLEKVLSAASNDTMRLKVKVDIAVEEGVMRASFWDSMVTETKRLDIHPAQVISNIYLGYAYFTDGKLVECKRYWKEAVALAERYNDFENGPPAYNNLAYLYEQQGAISDAIDLYFNSLVFLEKGHDDRGKSAVYNNLSGIYFDLKDFDNAYKYSRLAIAIRIRMKDSAQLAASLNNMGYYLQEQKQYEAALAYYDRALAIMKTKSLKGLMPNTLYNIGTILLKKGEYEKAAEKLNECRELFRDNHNMGGLANSITSLAEIDLKKGDTREAIKKGEESLKYAKELGFPDPLQHVSEVLYRAYKQTGNNTKALEMHELFTRMKDSVSKEENHKAGIQREMKYLFDKKTIADSIRTAAKINLEQQKHSEEIRRQKLYSWAGVIGAILMLLVAGISFRAYRTKQKANMIIREQKMIVDEKQKEIVDSINYAQRIQYAMLANDELLEKNLAGHFVLFQPKAIVSGDFYWATKKEDRFYLAVCDSTGHGVPGAFMSLLNISFLNEAITEKNISAPNLVLDHVRKRLIENVSQDGAKDGMDGALICFENGKITYAAAHNPPLIIQNGLMKELPYDKMPVGKGEKEQPFTCHAIDFRKGDMLYLYTDGYADQFGGPNGKKFKYRQLQQLILAHHLESLTDQKILYSKAINDWKGTLEQVDDILMIGIRL